MINIYRNQGSLLIDMMPCGDRGFFKFDSECAIYSTEKPNIIRLGNMVLFFMMRGSIKSEKTSLMYNKRNMDNIKVKEILSYFDLIFGDSNFGLNEVFVISYEIKPSIDWDPLLFKRKNFWGKSKSI